MVQLGFVVVGHGCGEKSGLLSGASASSEIFWLVPKMDFTEDR